MNRRSAVRNRDALSLLVDNIAALPHPSGQTIKHPYFGGVTTIDSPQLRELTAKFCEAIIALIEDNFELKKRR